MYCSFNKLSKTSRIWIFPCNRRINKEESEEIFALSISFINNWTSHNNNLLASIHIPYERFIIYAVDSKKNIASGCSIDKLMRFIQDLERKFNLVLLDKMNVTYKQENKLFYKPLSVFKSMIKKGLINSETIVFNNLVDNISTYHSEWEIALKNSWHSRFLN
ncbi:MAG: ABC transporter ATPase [Flavobacteriaceae bacterium]|mgnify:FL=1|nr:ABC transporter ATPase [Flavobacteriaceae bacterium]|tara:strand:+ start:17090 stop:17575 length:486 start_codon:yes stop_codon:yes gene_type:complete